MAKTSTAQSRGIRLLPAFAFGMLLVRPVAAADAPAKPPAPLVDYVIVVTGGELLDGAYADAHTLFLTRTLHPLGLHCIGSMIVDDKQADIAAALGFASRRAKLAIVTGGLGPTENDVTREAISQFTGIALREQPEVVAGMEQRFKVPREQLRPNLRRQAQVPERGTYLPSAGGTAVGLVFERPEMVIVALPGPPRELQPMVRDELVPYLSRRFGTRTPGCRLLLRFVGLGQSQISHAIDAHAPLPADVAVFSQFEGGRVDYTFCLPDDTPQDRARLEELKRKILAIRELGDCVYADDETSLEEHVAKLLAARTQRLALAEAGSGGALAAALAGAERARAALAGAYVAPTEDALRRLLGVPDQQWASATERGRIELLAAAAAERTGSPWAVAVGDAEPDPSGNRSVAVVFRMPDGRTEQHTVPLRGSSDPARAHAATQLLDQLRRRLR